MRLRAQSINVTAFSKLVDSISKLSKRAVFRFTPTELKIISTGDFDDGVRFFGSVVELFGTNYRIESNANNEISLELSTYALSSALRQSSATPIEFIIRLGKLGRTPFLSLNLTAVGPTGVDYSVEQCVAVKVLKPIDAAALREPSCPDPEIKITLPKLSDVCKVAERLKSLSDTITVSASKAGGFRLGVSTDHADVETEWRGLSIVSGPSEETQEEESVSRSKHSTNEFFQAKVRSRGLLKFLHAHPIGRASIACICEGHSLIMLIYIKDVSRSNMEDSNDGLVGTLFAYLPVVNEDGDQ
ncbi:checkpoint protein Hus1/Mec3 [Phakopsora pachyrhizi]|uniref:Checkpoint protein n=1 Tax=Phakopsora pachyrhizi TaxID=170000 RepID=A0AAV0ATQ1_PHAPC|nr:checkpoint protein Hus1/Mec3 [Phakopsora pachyrhizi]CAH7671304.1 checkpoint protein Hus1/Mec3 [Phakopsora pachyrhizi]